jgi:hypothetical protein
MSDWPILVCFLEGGVDSGLKLENLLNVEIKKFNGVLDRGDLIERSGKGCE